MTKTSRSRIIAAARDLMRDKGYAGTSMSELAERVGLLKGSLYAHFPSKEALVPEVLALTLQETFDGLSPTGDWRGDYERSVDRLIDLMRRHRRCIGLHLAYGLDSSPPGLQAGVAQFFLEIRSRLRDTLVQGLEPERAERLALDTLTMIEGATLWLALQDDAGPIEAARRELLARAEGLALPVTDTRARALLDMVTGDWQGASLGEKRLAARVVAAEDDLLMVRAALAGQAEAESCFR